MKLIRNLFKKADIHLSESEMSIYVNNLRLDSLNLIPEKSRIHVEKCDSCKNGVVEILGFIQSENIALEESSDSTLLYRAGVSLTRLIPLVAAMFVLMMIPISYSIYNDGEKVYALNDDYELLIGSVFRSEKIEILLPPPTSMYSSSIVFKLAQLPEEPLYLYIHDVDDNIVHEEIFDKTEIILNLDVENGVYYWKLESEEDLISVGKIIK